MPVDPEIAHHRAVRAANVRWARAGERQRHGAKISESRLRRHEVLVDPNSTLDATERRQLAINSLRAEIAGLALASAKARARKREVESDAPTAA